MADEAPTVTLPAIPTAEINDALLHLRRPFTPAAVKWKIQASDFKSKPKKDATWVLVVPYIDARLVSARLNAVVGGGWEEEEVAAPGEFMLRYRLKVLGQRHTDIGEGQGKTNGMKTKAADSDALKRVAVRFGIGEYLYAMPPFNFFVTPQGDLKDDKPTVKRMESGKPGYLKDAHEDWCRTAYEEWLTSEGEEQFGPVLNHGDAAAGSVGVLIEDGAPEVEASDEDLAPAALDDDDAKRLRAEIEEVYGGLCKVNPDRLARGRVDKMVEDAAHSHQELERVRDTLVNLELTEGELSGLRDQLIKKIGVKAAKPLIDSAERRGSQEERIASMKKAIEATDQAEPDGK